MTISHFLQQRAITTFVWVLAGLLLLQPAAPAIAEIPNDCEAKLKDAERKFYNGDFDQSIALVKDCLAKADFPDSKKKDAYELLAQNYLGKSHLAEARNAIKKLLELAPSYVPPKDAPELAAEVENVRKQMAESKQGEATTEKVKTADEGGFPQTWHYIVGGVLVGGVAALLLLNK